MATKRELEERARPELNRVLQPGEMIVAADHAVTLEEKAKGELFAFKAVARSRHYWVVVTGERLILIGMGQGALPKEAAFERAEPLSRVAVLNVKRSFGQQGVNIRVGDVEMTLRVDKQLARALESGAGGSG